MARLALVDWRLRWLAVALIAGADLLASVVRADGVSGALGPFGVVGLDKWLHALGYALLALALAYALAERPTGRVAATVFVGVIGFGFGVELLQATIPYRDFSWIDTVANGVGSAIGATTWSILRGQVTTRD